MKHLVGAGRALGLCLVREEPLGFLLSSSTCKLLLGRPDLVTWHDLEEVVVHEQFGALAACMEEDLSKTDKAATFERFKVSQFQSILGLLCGGASPRFTDTEHHTLTGHVVTGGDSGLSDLVVLEVVAEV